MLWSLWQLVVAAALAASWALCGFRLLPARLRREDPLLVWSTATALGTGATILGLSALAAAHAFWRPAIAAVAAIVALGAGLGAREAARERAWTWRRPILPAGWPARLALAGLVGVLALTLVSALAPPSSMDATVYHLRVPREFLRSHTWVALADPHSYQALNVEMLFAEGLVLGGPVTAALAHWILGVAAIAAAGAWGRRLGGRAIWAAAIFGGTALYAWEAPSAFIDLGLALWAPLAIYWGTRSERDTAPIVLAGVLAGLAGGTKFTGLVASALTGAAALAVVAPDWGRGLRRFVTVGVIATALASPWYLRNLILTGDPIYPIAGSAFGLNVSLSSLVGMRYGLGMDPLHLATSAFDLLVRGEAFDQGWAIGPAFLALVPIGVVAVRQRRLALILAGALLAWWLSWFFTSPQTRFLLPLAPIAAGIAGVAVTAAVTSGVRALRLAALGVVAVAMVEALGVSALGAARDAKVVAGLEGRSTYLERNSWNYVAFENANRLLPPDARVAAHGATNFFYLDARADDAGGRGESAASLRAAGFTHRLEIAPCPAAPTRAEERVLWEGSYGLRLSRLRGGVARQVCARLTELPR